MEPLFLALDWQNTSITYAQGDLWTSRLESFMCKVEALKLAFERDCHQQPSPRPPYPIRSYHPMNLIPFRCRTSTFSRSFFSIYYPPLELSSFFLKRYSYLPLFSPIACLITYDFNSFDHKSDISCIIHPLFLDMYIYSFTLQISQCNMAIECY